MVEHHGSTTQTTTQQEAERLREVEAKERLLQQMLGKAEKTFSQGKISADDEGDLAFAIAADPQRKVIIIEFTKPIRWLGMDLATAEGLRNLLDKQIQVLKG